MLNVKPGDTFEDYLVWKLNLHVLQPAGAPISLGIARTPSVPCWPRQSISWTEFQFLVESLSPLRPIIEGFLADYDPQECDWLLYDAATMEECFDESIAISSWDHLKQLRCH